LNYFCPITVHVQMLTNWQWGLHLFQLIRCLQAFLDHNPLSCSPMGQINSHRFQGALLLDNFLWPKLSMFSWLTGWTFFLFAYGLLYSLHSGWKRIKYHYCYCCGHKGQMELWAVHAKRKWNGIWGKNNIFGSFLTAQVNVPE